MSDLLNQASLVMVPSGYKEDTVYSVVPSDGSGDLSFTRASNGTRVNSAGLVEVCPWNLAQYSEEFDNGVYVKLRASVTANAITAPNGTTTADKIESTSTGGAVELYQLFTLITGQTYSASVYMKKGSGNTEMSNVDVYTLGGGYVARITVNFGTGTITQSVGSGATIESVGDGWYRVNVPFVGYTGNNYIYIGSSGDYFPSGQYVYAWGLQLNIGSTANPYFPTTDRLNVPRLTYQNGGGGCPSLLLEKQSTNLFSYSEQFDNAAWVKGLVSISANTITSPDGTQNADSIIDNTTNSRHVMEQAITGDLSISRAMSLYAKQNTLRYLYMSVTNAGDSHFYSAIFDLQSGTVSATKVNGSATINASIESVGNGWYRCTITGTMTSGTATFYPLIGTSDRGGFTGTLVNNNAPSYAGSGQSLYIWGAQLEASSYPTSYIPTTSSSATRVADACLKTGISSLIGQTSGVLFVDFYAKGSYDSNNLLMLISGGSGGEIVYLNLVGGTIEAYIAASSTQQFLYNGTTALVANTRHKLAIAYASNDIVLYHNGVQLATDTSATIPACSLVRIGDFLGGLYQFGNTINEAILFPTRLTNAELASITTL